MLKQQHSSRLATQQQRVTTLCGCVMHVQRRVHRLCLDTAEVHVRYPFSAHCIRCTESVLENAITAMASALLRTLEGPTQQHQVIYCHDRDAESLTGSPPCALAGMCWASGRRHKVFDTAVGSEYSPVHGEQG